MAQIYALLNIGVARNCFCGPQFQTYIRTVEQNKGRIHSQEAEVMGVRAQSLVKFWDITGETREASTNVSISYNIS